jgi:hypothetical protein
MMTNKTNSYLVVWDCYGLESLFNITDWSFKATYNTLMELAPPTHIPLNELMLRARYNPQRNYEIYTFQANKDVTELSLREAFDADPQYMADWVRKNGSKLYSDRETEKGKRVIT